MMKERIICNVMTGEVRRELFEDNTPEIIDYTAEIAECKQRLAQTDYVAIKIAEGAATREQYADIIGERALLRERIGELERLQKEQAT